MDCTSLQAILSGEREDDLGPAESQAFDAHLRACDACRDALARVEGELEPLVDRFAPPELPAAQWDRVTRAVKAEAARPALTVHAGGVSRAPRALAIAAAFLLAAGIGALLPLDLFKSGLPGGGATDGLSQMPGPSGIVGPGPTPAPDAAGADTGLPEVAKSRVDVRWHQAEEGFESGELLFDCADERMVLIYVRQKDL
jgi:hypothetical protein